MDVDMSTHARAIIVGTDFSSSSLAVTTAAAELARRRGHDVVLAHVVDGPLLPARAAPALHERLRTAARALSAHGCRVRTALLHDGNCGAQLAALADEERATLLVVGAQGEGMRSPLGTVAAAAIRHTTCPLLVVRRAERLWASSERPRLRVLAPFALDDTDAALAESLALVAATGDVDADFVHWTEIPAPRSPTVARAADKAVRAHFHTLPIGVVVRGVFERTAFGRLDTLVAELARERDSDLVVCGSHHRHGFDRFRSGSIAEGIVLHAPVSVLVARAPGSLSTSLSTSTALSPSG
jgi:nucleotide-binding universal stress UspA family protein